MGAIHPHNNIFDIFGRNKNSFQRNYDLDSKKMVQTHSNLISHQGIHTLFKREIPCVVVRRRSKYNDK